MDFSALFTQDPSFIHLNAGSLSRTPLKVLDFMEAERRLAENNPTRSVYDSPRLFWNVQVKLAAFLGAKPEDLFFRSNITSALNDFFFSLEISEGEILFTGMEYGATVNLAKVRAQQLGLKFRELPLPLSPEVKEEELVSAIIQAFTPSTKILLLSHVITGTGLIMPVALIAAEAKRRGIIVVVDGAHAPGALPLDIGALGVDFYGGNFHKWFLGPVGTAFGWVNPDLVPSLRWKFGGWASFEVPGSFKGFEGGEEAARRLFPGTMDTTPFLALGEVLEFWEKHGVGNLRARQSKLRDLAAGWAESFGWERVSPRDPALLGPLVSFQRPPNWPQISPVETAVRIYRECAVQLAVPVVQGNFLVRLSPGVYSSEKEVESGMGRLKNWV